jgi:L-threonylcarbamoyladenylate synthase
MRSVEDVVRAIEAGELVVIPTDTVYGLACAPALEPVAHRLSELKRRPPDQPIALVALSVQALLELVPELPARTLQAVLPSPLTLVVPNPAQRFPWLGGARPEAMGIRVPELTGPAADVLQQVGVVAATSANLHGGPDPRLLSDVPAAILDAVSAVLDGGELPGAPSTVVDLTGASPRVLREGAVPAAEALARVGRAVHE